MVELRRVTPAASLLVSVLLAVLIAMAASGCESSKVEGRDLHGVFSARSAVAAASGSAASGAKPKAPPATGTATSSAAQPSIEPLERVPPQGQCIAKAGEPKQGTGRVGRRPACRGATILEHQGPERAPRYACVFSPRGATERAPLPLLIFFHDVHDDPSALHKKTHLRKHYRTFDLSGEPQHAGFIVLAPQARRLAGVLRFDSDYHADENADVQALDKFVQQLQDQGLIDPTRIYALGHGRGGEMAALYSMLRPARVAAFATFASNAAAFRWSCSEPAPPAAILYRACDTTTPCADVEQWLAERERLSLPTMSLRLGSGKRTAASCALHQSRCRKSVGNNNHVRWPRGRETNILEYLARYSLRLSTSPAPPKPTSPSP